MPEKNTATEVFQTRVDTELCIGCGECCRVCPTGTLALIGDKAVVTDKATLACGHCEAVCPTGAVSVTGIDPEQSRFATFTADERLLPPGGFDPGQLVRLMRSRRSCRHFTDKPVPRAVLEDLVKIGTTAPSGTNSQRWTFTLLPTRTAVFALAERIADFFRGLNRMAAKASLRFFMRLIGKRELDEYYHGYYATIEDALRRWDEKQEDLLFHGAPAAIVVGSAPGASCPMEDALLATQNILLGAHCLGLGTCLIGYATAAMHEDPAIKDALGIPRAEAVYAVIALGYPDETYARPTGRKKITPRWFEG